jgi:hypothetical protein
MSCEVVKKKTDPRRVLKRRDNGEFDAVQNTTKLLKHNFRNYMSVKLKTRLGYYLFVSRPKIG